MILKALFFYLFAALTVASAFMVISRRNPVHSVLFLIVAFFNAAGLFVLLGAEFLAMLLVVVYVGAVAVLFLFVVMMLDVDFAELRQGFLQYLPVGALVGLILVAELLMVLAGAHLDPSLTAQPVVPLTGIANGAVPAGQEWLRGAMLEAHPSNIQALGSVLYTRYVYLFQVAGMVLLVAMIGAIVLTLRHKEGVKRQKVSDQVARTKATAIAVVKVESGKGL
jgi:NADH-quinone oxidoreductase subunit J